MADRELFRWPGAAIMGDDRPRYPRMDEGFVGSPVWGKGGVIAALLARVAEVEAERDRLLEAARAYLREYGLEHATVGSAGRLAEEARRAE